jgi:hypothetical protein
MTTPNFSEPTWKHRRSVPDEYVLSSDGSS